MNYVKMRLSNHKEVLRAQTSLASGLVFWQ